MLKHSRSAVHNNSGAYLARYRSELARHRCVRDVPESAFFFVGADELRLRNHMALHRIQKLSFCRVPEIRQHRVERGELVKISMPPDRWTGAAVTGPFPIVEALLRSRWKATFCRALRKAMRVGRNVVHDPMHPRRLGSARIGRVRVVDDQHEALRALWSSRPLQRRRDVGALTAILLGDCAIVRKRMRCQDERHSKYLHVGGRLRAVTAHVNLNRLADSAPPTALAV